MPERFAGLPTGRGTPGAAFMRGGLGNAFFASWRPALRDPRDEVRASYVNAAARTIDAVHNSGWLAGVVDQFVAEAVGQGLRLKPMPDYEAIGWDRAAAQAWSKRVQWRFARYAENPNEVDLGGRWTLGQISAAALRSWIATGEITAQLPAFRRDLGESSVKVLLLPSTRLMQKSEPPGLVQGVRMDATGYPLAYHFEMDDPALGSRREVVVRARDGVGRPQVAHVFDGMAGQVRGITPLAPALLVVRQFDQLANATLSAALVQSIFAATVESTLPTSQVLQGLQSETEQKGFLDATGSVEDLIGSKGQWYDSTKIDLGGHGKIAHMFPGDVLKFNRSEHPNDNYEAFAKFLLREIARCVGVTFETMTGDYSGATYASLNIGTAVVWEVVKYRRKYIVGRLLQAVYEAWLEDEIEHGRIPFPGGLAGFLALRSAAVSCEWVGSGRPPADELKTAKQLDTLLNACGIMSRRRACDLLGFDYDDELDDMADEKAMREERDIPEPGIGHNGGPALDDPAEADPTQREDA